MGAAQHLFIAEYKVKHGGICRSIILTLHVKNLINNWVI